MPNLLIFGLGYTGTAIARAAEKAGFTVTATSRDAAPGTIPFDAAHDAIRAATHVLTTAAPTADGDPVLARYAQTIATAPALQWIGYLSSTVVYGNRDGAWVDEDTPPAPSQPRGHYRANAETAWQTVAPNTATDIFRLGGIYGPGRSTFDDLREHTARHMIKPGHQFGRIHRDDIARAVVTAMQQDRPPGRRILNLVDDEPAESATIMLEAAALLGVTPPQPTRYEDALPAMSPMARSFWAENRKVACAKTKAALNLEWLYPSYREGLRAILAEENRNRPA